MSVDPLWPEVPAGTRIHGVVTLDVFAGPDGKPVLRVGWGGEFQVYLTANIAEMIGGVGRGATLRWQDHHVPGMRES